MATIKKCPLCGCMMRQPQTLKPELWVCNDPNCGKVVIEKEVSNG